MKRYKFILLLFCILHSTFYISSAQSNQTILLNSNWQFRKTGDSKWLPATVPGTVHTDLLSNKIINDPYFSDNEKKLQWIENEDWEYQTFFDVDENLFSQKHIELQFDGLDTYSKVFLNDSLILSADNMFRTWNNNVKKYLRKEKNHLHIIFESAVKHGKDEAKKLPYTLPSDEKIFTRKAQYQYGWDWGPRFVTCGIWRTVSLKSWNDVVIRNIQIIQKSLSGTLAEMNAVVELEADADATISARCIPAGENIIPEFPSHHIAKGTNKISIPFTIQKPKRWWCNGLGDAFLYHYSVGINDKMNSSDNRQITFGLRTIELVQENDSVAIGDHKKGTSFYFKLNGVPVFMKGANYIPPDNFLPRVTEDRYKNIIQSAVDANMNMLRVWGGGVYENDNFYDLCDEKGILVWQDFMFACAMYPGDSSFTENVRAEVIDNVKRLHNHPCIALWCGNNEIDEGWKNWEWQKQYHYSENDSTKIWSDYQNFFQKIIPEILDTLLPSPLGKGRGWGSYISTSPQIGWGHSESLSQGDSHYWGVWWGMEPFDVYKKKVGRFMSEYGFQGMPPLSTFKKFCTEKDLSLNSRAVKNHQKHPVGYKTIQTYFERQYKQPIADSFGKDFENYIYVSQLLQAEGIRTAIEAHRTAKPYCMGTLYWQLNDCWPVTSWSSTDYYNHWKALHYFVKHAYEKSILTTTEKNNVITMNVVSDDIDTVEAKLHWKLIDFTGNLIRQDSTLSIKFPNKNSKVYSIRKDELLYSVFDARVYLLLELEKNYQTIARNIYYFREPKDLILDKTKINFTISQNQNGQTELILSASSLAKNIFIDVQDEKITLSDNYFDLLPKENKTITLQHVKNIEELKNKITIKSLVDTY